MALTTIRVSPEDFSLDDEVARVREASPSAGAVVSFVGVVRNKNDGAAVSKMTLEHYPGMTEKALGKIVEKARERFHLEDVVVIHRVGDLSVGAQIVLCTAAKPLKAANTSWTGLKPRRLSGSARRRPRASAGSMRGSRMIGQRPAGPKDSCQKAERASNISLKPNVKRARSAGDAPLIF